MRKHQPSDHPFFVAILLSKVSDDPRPRLESLLAAAEQVGLEAVSHAVAVFYNRPDLLLRRDEWLRLHRRHMVRSHGIHHALVLPVASRGHWLLCSAR